MNKRILSRCLAATTAGLLGQPAVAAQTDAPLGQAAAGPETNSTYADLTLSGGYSSDPSFQSGGGGKGSAFVSLSALLSHRWSSERTSTALTGFWEGSDYFNYRVRNLLSLHGRTAHAVSERLNISASAGIMADFSGQLSNRFLDVAQPGQPDTGPPLPGPPGDMFLYGGREYRGELNLGLAWQASERSEILANVGVSRSTFSESGLLDHTTETASIEYLRSLSERTDVGLDLTSTATQFSGSSDATLILGPAVTIRSHLSENWTLGGSAGLTFSRVRHNGGDSNSTEPSLSASLCHNDVTSHLCARAAHYTHSSAVAELITATTVGLDWVKELDAKQTIQLSAAYMHYSHPQVQTTSFQSSQFRAAASYSRLVSDRLSIGAGAAASRLAGGTGPGQHGTDISASVFLSYRWGNRA